MFKDFLLDSNIRFWVFLPVVLLTLFVEVLRHYSILLFSNNPTPSLAKIQQLEMKKRVCYLLTNYKNIPKAGFEMRKAHFHPDTGFLELNPPSSYKQRRITSQTFPLGHDKFLNIMKGHAINHLPMILAGAWVSYTFSGFICTKVPFPLTLGFKSMLQRNIDLAQLNPSWVSSCSWYFLNVFGLRNFLNMFLDDDIEWNIPEMETFEGGCFKEEFQSLEMTVY